ncbi:MAG: DNA recombination protein RmuC [Clostridiales bacterium]|nr:DNA recombination protein RmuC [Clostridiales bacterium]
MEIVTLAILLLLCALAAANIFITLRNGKDKRLHHFEKTFDTAFSKNDSLIRDEFVRNREETRRALKENREESGKASRETREELSHSVKALSSELSQSVRGFSDSQQQQFDMYAKQVKNLTDSFETRLKEIREDTSKRLDEMRKTVDENLKDTVEKRFNDSFKMISERLELVHKGLGEMQTLATGVGDLKRVLTNVKTRGNIGEFQLGAILEQVLIPEQFEAQVAVKPGSGERVDFVIKLPDKNSLDKTLLLPVDSKFPIDDYERLIVAYEAGGQEQDRAAKAFEDAVRKCAKSIHEKYINPPDTTNFAIMFVPTEGLYAEIVRRPHLFESLQRQYQVTVVGPTNLAAFLNSLQMGFRTLAIERRSNEVWALLGAIKTEFGKFGGVLNKIKDKLDSASNEIKNAGTRTRAIERKLRGVEQLPAEESASLLDMESIENEREPLE